MRGTALSPRTWPLSPQPTVLSARLLPTPRIWCWISLDILRLRPQWLNMGVAALVGRPPHLTSNPLSPLSPKRLSTHAMPHPHLTECQISYIVRFESNRHQVRRAQTTRSA